MNVYTGIGLTFLLLVLNGLFVAAEFALVAAKRPRLEKAAAEGSRGAASAVAGIRELSLMLAGAQLGITMCSLALGIVAEPVVEKVFHPLFATAGLPSGASHVLSFVIALALVTFLHMVIGEMAPKSWAIAAPERSATLLALPFRAFTKVFRPLIAVLNGVTNLLLRLGGVRPRDAFAVSRTPEQLRYLVAESRRLGLIEEDEHHVLSRVLDAPETTLGDLVFPLAQAARVPPAASPDEVISVAVGTGRTRLLIETAHGEILGLVHARDAYLARIEGRHTAAAEFAHALPVLASDTAIAEAVATLRDQHSQVGLVREGGKVTGLISMDELLTSLLAPG